MVLLSLVSTRMTRYSHSTVPLGLPFKAGESERQSLDFGGPGPCRGNGKQLMLPATHTALHRYRCTFVKYEFLLVRETNSEDSPRTEQNFGELLMVSGGIFQVSQRFLPKCNKCTGTTVSRYIIS